MHRSKWKCGAAAVGMMLFIVPVGCGSDSKNAAAVCGPTTTACAAVNAPVIAGSGAGAGGMLVGSTGGVPSVLSGGGGAPASSATGGTMGGTMTGTGGMMAGTGGMKAGTGGMMAGTGGMMAGTGGMMAGTGGSAAIPDSDLTALRKFCVDTINMYRATIMPTIAPLKEASAATEMCSDKYATADSNSGVVHGSAGMCVSEVPGSGLSGGQDACPWWSIGGFSGNATLKDAIGNCLAGMWEEGVGFKATGKTRAQCMADYQGCFLKYGHWLNMSSTQYSTVSCGIVKSADAKCKYGSPPCYYLVQDF